MLKKMEIRDEARRRLRMRKRRERARRKKKKEAKKRLQQADNQLKQALEEYLTAQTETYEEPDSGTGTAGQIGSSGSASPATTSAAAQSESATKIPAVKVSEASVPAFRGTTPKSEKVGVVVGGDQIAL
ncbi:unnamed protein product [Cylicostephanus goldi]|uniref:Uncharacterized protein n=1 Tax=Cylicostephanus goldi TaxID=71465 RepID=A0A3P6QK86_CYLGO|nr:unnamed protein product [Cylicostephanus goldi]